MYEANRAGEEEKRARRREIGKGEEGERVKELEEK